MLIKGSHRALAYGLACVLGLSSPFQGIAYGTPSAGYSLYKGEEKVYLAPIEMYYGAWDNVGIKEPITINNTATQRLQIKDKALVTENNGIYTVRMEYASYSAHDMIQIINPDKVQEIKNKVTTENGTVTALQNVPMGDFNAPEQYKYPTNATKHISTGYISSDYNDYYWHNGEVSVSYANEAQDTGYITFQTEDLSGEWIVRSYFSRQSTFSTASTPIIIRFSDTVESLPQNLTISESSAETGYTWTNFVKATKLNVGNRNDDPDVLTFLNNLFEEKVVVKKEEDGGLKAILTFKESILQNHEVESTSSNMITSVKYAKNRTVDVTTSSLAVHLRQEMVDVTWSENLLQEDGIIEIPYKDLTDNMLFQISTYELDQINEGKTQLNQSHYYGSLWLYGYTDLLEEKTEGYQVPVKKYHANWNNINNSDAEGLIDIKYYLQNKDNVLISDNEDGTYQIRMEYVGYSVYDMIQIIDPDQLDDFKEIASVEFMGDAPMGDFNVPNTFKNKTRAQKWIDAGKITSEFNEYYLNNQEVTIEQANELMDTGYIIWNTDDLKKQYVIRAYTSSIYSSSWITACFTAIYEFDINNAVKLPENLTAKYNSGEMGYRWTNYAKPRAKKDGARNRDDLVKELLYEVFSYTVAYEKREDGSIDATFTFKEFDETDPITSVKLATSKSTNLEEHTTYSLVNETVGNIWEELLDESKKTVTINFKNLMDSKVIEVSTKSNDTANEEQNNETKRTNYIGTLWLAEDIMAEADEQILYSTNGNGARVITDTESVPENSTFLCETVETPRYFWSLEQAKETITAYSKDTDSYVLYDYYIHDSQGNEVTPKNYVTIELPIPDNMDAERVLVYYCDSKGGYGNGLPKIGTTVVGEIVRNSLGNWVLRITPYNLDMTYFSIAIYDPGTPIAEEEILALDAGYYSVRTTIKNMGGSQSSMANTSILENRGVLHVKEKGGDYDLYLKMKGVSMTGYGYVSKMRVYDTNESTSELADVLAYMSTADMLDNEFEYFGHTQRSEEDLMIEDLCEREQVQYLYRVRLPLSERYREGANGWRLGFNVPLMNAFTGVDINNEKEAILRILEGSIQPIDINDLEGYNNSILQAEINEAAWHLDTMENGTERDTLEQAIKTAEAAYKELKVTPDEEILLLAVSTLHNALVEAGGGSELKKTLSNGTYHIPFKIYDSSSAGSQESNRAVYFDSATIDVGTSTMTVTLNTKANAAGDAITSLRYDNGSRLTAADEIYDADGNVSGYTFTRAYTENQFELEIYTTAYNYSNMLMLQLDFENAEKLDVTEEDIEELKNLYTELQTLVTTEGNEALYTDSSFSAAASAVETLQAILGYMEWEDLEYTTVQTQLKTLKTVKTNLVLVADLQSLLTGAIQSGKSYQEKRDKYLSSSMEPLDAAVTAAETVLNGFTEAAQADIEKAIQDIETAIEGLEEVNDKTELNNKITEAVAYYDQADLYTYSTKIALIEAFDAARNVASLENPSLALMEQHLSALEKAINALEFQSREDLASLITSARGYDISLYEEASVKTLAAAIVTAQGIYDNAGLGDQDYKDAITNLQSAMDQMVLLPDNTEKLEALQTFVTNLENHLAAVDPEDTYEPASYASLMASIEAAQDMLNTENGYKLTEELIDAQMDALEGEYEALIELVDLNGTTSYSYRKVSFDAITLDDEEELEDELEEIEEDLLEEEEDDLETTEAEKETPKESQKETDSETQAPQKETEESKPETETGSSAAEESESEPESKDETEKESEEDSSKQTEAAEEAPTEKAEEKEEDSKDDFDDSEETSNVEEKAEEKEEADEGGKTLALSKSTRQTIRVFAAATPSNAEKETDAVISESKADTTTTSDNTTKTSSGSKSTMAASSRSVSSLGETLEDGVYAIDYVLWQYAKNSESMGNGAVMDAFPDRDGKQAKIIIEGDDAYLQIGLQAMEYTGLTGHLLEMFIMDNLVTDNDDVIEDYTPVYPEILDEYEERDDYGPPSGKKYPKLIEFNITKYVTVKNAYIPVQVNVPVMGSSAEQPAYIRFYWNTFVLVEGAKPDDSNDPEEVVLDLEELNHMVETVSSVKKADYTTKSYEALVASITAADALPDLTGATQDMVDVRIDALEATYKALLLVRTEDPDDNLDDDPKQDGDDKIAEARDELQLLYLEALSHATGNYSQSSLTALNTAISAALTVLKNSDATELQINRAISNLEKAINALEEADTSDSTTVKKSALNALISTATSLNSSDYTSTSWLQLTTALTLARITYSDGDATQAEVDAQVSSLQSAINSLTTGSSGSGSDSSSSSDTDNDDGYYSVSVRLWHSSMNKASMGDNAVTSKAYVHIDDGDVTMRLVTKKMSVSGITAHLHDFWIYLDGEYEEAELISTENSKWIYEFELPNDTSTYYKCQVDPQVDVMGDDPVKARLKVTWSSLKEIDEDDWDDLEGDTDDDDDDSTSSSTKSTSTELTHSGTGVRVQGNTGGPGVVLEVNKLENGTQFDVANNFLAGKVNKFVLYDIKLQSGTNYVQPTGSVTLRIPIPAGYDTSKLVLYYIDDNGNAVEVSGKVNGSYYEASVTHFSLYSLAESDQVAVAAAAPAASTNTRSSGGSTSTSTSTKTSTKTNVSTLRGDSTVINASAVPAGEYIIAGRSIPYTGDKTPVKELMGVGLLAALLCLATLYPGKRRKKEES